MFYFLDEFKLMIAKTENTRELSYMIMNSFFNHINCLEKKITLIRKSY